MRIFHEAEPQLINLMICSPAFAARTISTDLTSKLSVKAFRISHSLGFHCELNVSLMNFKSIFYVNSLAFECVTRREHKCKGCKN